MTEFGKINSNGSESVYLQIIRRFKLLILQGKYADGMEAPSRRMLAARLGVNPNTVQKAFAELEREGLIITPPNAKSIIRVNDAVVSRLRIELIENEIASVISAAKNAGMDYKQLTDLISLVWEKNNSVQV